jgi:hypothetical protein
MGDKLKEYKIRLPKDAPEVTSEAVAQWLDQAIADGTAAKLPADPGGGAARVSLSLDSEKVVSFANKKRERITVVLRRLIASRVKFELPPAKDEETEERPAANLPDRVLPRKLSYDESDFLDVVRGMDKGLALVYRWIYSVKELKPAETPEADRKLAGAVAEVCNRRSPGWFVANADLFRLAATSFRWSMTQTELLDAQVRGAKRIKEPEGPKERVTGDVTAAAGEPSAQPGPESLAAAVIEHMGEPVQEEGQF